MAEELKATTASDLKVWRWGFTADLAFLLCLPWLVLWRVELSLSSGRSLWLSGWPALILAAFLVAAYLIGLVQHKPRGFLPYMLRWACLAAALVLPAWIAISVAEVGGQRTLRGAAQETRRSAEDLLASENDPADKQALEQVVVAARAGETLADVIDLAGERKVEVPRVDLAALLGAGSGVEQLDPVVRETLEQSMGIAAAMEAKGEGEFEAMAEEAGLSDTLMQVALIAGLGVLLGPVLGLAPAVVGKILLGLLAAGKFTPAKLLSIGAAILSSMGAGGVIDPDLLMQNIDRFGVMADELDEVLNASQEAGGTPVPMRTKKPNASNECPKKLQNEVLVGLQGQAAEERLANACPGLSAGAIKKLVEARRKP